VGLPPALDKQIREAATPGRPGVRVFAKGFGVNPGTGNGSATLSMQTPDIPLTLKNCRMLGFKVDLDDVHYSIAHEIVVRHARNSAMAAVPFAIFAFLTRIASHAPDFFKIPHEGLSEVGFHIEI
jgi:hypothetical protein